jgi:hypothetical protein
MSGATYTLYSSATLQSPTSPAIQPDGYSKLCLSCHDGTVAIGAVVNTGASSSTISMSGTASGGFMPGTPGAGSVNMGTDLSGHHPISIEVNAALISAKNTQCVNGLITMTLCSPPAASPVQLQPTKNQFSVGPHNGLGVQCSSCHDPHEDNPAGNDFLRVNVSGGTDPLCTICHIDCSSTCP